ncbi:diguanylate cyclase [Halomonas sp. 11-S5]|uniref:sensor domain-containing diguanylate cyclase n=1 Tax=Halomonas sp. 11-S5 TaxID=2994064 RepID=UPI0032AFD886
MPRRSLARAGAWALSLKGRLLLGLAATWIIVVALVMWAGWTSSRSLSEESNLIHLNYEARLIADELTHQVDSRLAALGQLAERMPPKAGEGSDPHTLLAANSALLEWFEGLLLFDAAGTIRADWPQMPGREGLDAGFRDYFQFVKGFKRPYVSEPFIGRVSGMPMLLFLVPLFDEAGDFQGALGGLVNIRQGGLFELLRRIRLGDGGYAAIATASGRILYHPDRSRLLASLPAEDANPSLTLAQLGWEGETRGPALDGQATYQAFRQIWTADWIVGVYLPREQVMSPVRGLFQRLANVGLLIAVVLLPLMGWLLWLALRPLYHLEGQIGELGRGERTHVALTSRMQEIQRVGDALNRLERERGQAMARWRDRQAFLEAILAESPVGMFVTDSRGRITYANRALLELAGRTASPRHHAQWLAGLHADDRDAILALWQSSQHSGEDFLRQFRYYRADGTLLWLEVHASRVLIDGQLIGFVSIVKDITLHREQESLRQWEAEHDPLTGLLNRRGFERRLEEALAAWRKAETPSALLLFDLDRFKPVNDVGGHALGDTMLRRIAEAVNGVVRVSDHVARQGGDEFAVLLPSCDVDQARRIAESLRGAVAGLSVIHEGREFRVTMSVGVTTLLAGDTDIQEVIGRADAASYEAKRRGRDGVILA